MLIVRVDKFCPWFPAMPAKIERQLYLQIWHLLCAINYMQGEKERKDGKIKILTFPQEQQDVDLSLCDTCSDTYSVHLSLVPEALKCIIKKKKVPQTDVLSSIPHEKCQQNKKMANSLFYWCHHSAKQWGLKRVTAMRLQAKRRFVLKKQKVKRTCML